MPIDTGGLPSAADPPHGELHEVQHAQAGVLLIANVPQLGSNWVRSSDFLPMPTRMAMAHVHDSVIARWPAPNFWPV